MALTDRITISYNCGPKGRAGQGGKATTRSNAAKLTTTNITAQDTALNTVVNNVTPLTNAVVSRHAFDHGTDDAFSQPGTPLNKGEKWVVTMQEGAGNNRFFTHTIPAPNESGTHLTSGTLNANLTDPDWAAYKVAVDALFTTPDGNAMALQSATILTRRR